MNIHVENEPQVVGYQLVLVVKQSALVFFKKVIRIFFFSSSPSENNGYKNILTVDKNEKDLKENIFYIFWRFQSSVSGVEKSPNLTTWHDIYIYIYADLVKEKEDFWEEYHIYWEFSLIGKILNSKFKEVSVFVDISNWSDSTVLRGVALFVIESLRPQKELLKPPTYTKKYTKYSVTLPILIHSYSF